MAKKNSESENGTKPDHLKLTNKSHVDPDKVGMNQVKIPATQFFPTWRVIFSQETCTIMLILTYIFMEINRGENKYITYDELRPTLF